LKIKTVVIENFKSVKRTEFDFQDLTILLGENNSGKTNILNALQMFFETTVRSVNEEHFFGKDLTKENNEIKITLTFDRLTPDELNDTRIGKYVIDGRLTIVKTIYWDPEKGAIQQKYSGLVREPKLPYLKLSGFDTYKQSLTKIVRENNLPEYFKAETGNVTQASYKEGLDRFIAEKHNEIEWDEPFVSTTQFLGWKEVAQSFMPMILYVPAVQEATEETTYTAQNLFGKLLDAMLFETSEKIPQFAKLQKILDNAREMLNRPTTGTDKRPAQIKELEGKLLEILKESMPSTRDVKIQVSVPEVTDLVQGGTNLVIDDGIETTVGSKGHGLQRALILAMFRLYAELRKTLETKQGSKTIIFAIEEPELYLHPQCQRLMLEALESISATDQIAFCTHSTFFIDMSHYASLVIVSKSDPLEGTKIFQCTREIFPPKEKAHFRMINEFDPERNEAFFSKEVVLVEGDSEKVAFPRISKLMGKNLNSKGISIVECGSKYNIVLFMKVLNEFKIPYVVVHDVDPVETGLTDERLEEAKRLFAENDKIRQILNVSSGRIETLDPDFEQIFGLSTHQIERVGKPYATFMKLQNMTKESIPPRVKEIIDAL
jgi:putative ATP-dependent endonuclease of OLD family